MIRLVGDCRTAYLKKEQVSLQLQKHSDDLSQNVSSFLRFSSVVDNMSLLRW